MERLATKEYRLWPYWMGLSVVDVTCLPPFYRTSGSMEVGDEDENENDEWPGWQLGYVD